MSAPKAKRAAAQYVEVPAAEVPRWLRWDPADPLAARKKTSVWYAHGRTGLDHRAGVGALWKRTVAVVGPAGATTFRMVYYYRRTTPLERDRLSAPTPNADRSRPMRGFCLDKPLQEALDRLKKQKVDLSEIARRALRLDPLVRAELLGKEPPPTP